MKIESRLPVKVSVFFTKIFKKFELNTVYEMARR